MVRKKLILFHLLIYFFTGVLIAANTGKLAGIVKDAETGKPLAGVNIILVGKILESGKIAAPETPLGAATDQDGYYYILNLEPGRYIFQAMMVGYETQKVVDILIESGRTVNQDFTLRTSLLETEAVVVEAKREIVKLDVSSSETVINQENSRTLPVSNVEQIISLSPGVSINANSDEITIRGGGSDQIMSYLDGFSMKDEIFNQPFLSYNRTSIKEISIKTGGFLAEYGDLRSGIIDVTSVSGGSKYSIAIDSRYEPADYRYYGPHKYTEDKYWLMYGSDWSMDTTILNQKFPHPSDKFIGWPEYAKQYLSDKDSTNDMTPNQRREMWRWRHRGREEGNISDHVIDATISGPVPGGSIPVIGEYFLSKLSFMYSFRDQFDAYAHPAYRDHFGLRNNQLKLTYNILPNMSLTFMGLRSTQFGMSKFEANMGDFAYVMRTGGEGTYNDTNNPLGDIITTNYGLSFKHVISPQTFYEVRINKMAVDYNFVHGPVRDSTIVKVIPGEFYTVEEGDTLHVSGYWDSATNTYIQKDTTLYGGDEMWCPPVYLDETPQGWPPYGAGLTEMDQPGRVNLLQSSNSTEISSGWTYNIRGDITHQANRYHLFKAGLIYTESKIARNWTKVTNALNDEWHQVIYNEYPKYYAGYVQDRIEVEGLIANIGVRGEVFDAGSQILSPDDPFNETFFDMYFRENVDSLPTAHSKKYFRVSPRLGISHPITTTSKIFFNYGHAYSTPRNSLRYGFKPKTYDWSRPAWIGNGNLKPYKTIQYELGYEQGFLQKYLIHAAVYYKDVSDQSNSNDRVQYFKPYTTDTQAFYYTWDNKNYQDIIGIELTLYKTLGNLFTGWIRTQFMGIKRGQIGYSKRYVEDDPNNVSTYSKYSYPDDILWDWKPTLMVNLDFHTPLGWGPDVFGAKIFGGWRINSIINWAAGSKFTWSPTNDPSVYNNMQYVDYFMSDFNLSKMFDIAGSKLDLYVNLHNPFNRSYLNTGLLYGLPNDESEERYKYYNSLKKGDKVGDYKQSYIVRPAEKPGQNYIARYGGQFRIVFGIRYNVDW